MTRDLLPLLRPLVLLGTLSFLSPAHAAFTAHGDGTVSDTVTGLMWDQCAWGQTGNDCSAGAASAHTWAQALGVAITANTSSHKGYSDWRLPSFAELESLVKIDAANPAIDTSALPNTPITSFWTSTTYALSTASARDVNFGDGRSTAYSKTNNFHVRLVRSGQSFASFDSDVAPTFSATGVSGTTTSATTLSATSNEAANGYWIVVARDATAPSAAQVKAATTYSGVTLVASGNAAMLANTAKTFSVSGLTAGTDYDLYLTAEDGSSNLSSATKVQFSTQAIDTTPDAFSLTAQNGAALSTATTSNAITVAGINSAAAISIVGGEYSVSTDGGTNWSDWSTTTPATVGLNNQIKVRLTSSASYSTAATATLTIGGVDGAFSVTTLDDTTPDTFDLSSLTNQTLSAVITTPAVTVAGLSAPVSASTTVGTIVKNGTDTGSSSTTVSNGDTVAVKLTASGSHSTAINGTLTIGASSDNFSVSTLADTVPDAFSFTAQSGAALSTVTTSNTLTVAGIDSAAAISIAGGEYSVSTDGGTNWSDWSTATPATVSVNHQVKVRLTSSASYSTAATATLTIGGVDGVFSVTTGAAPDVAPDAFSFTAQTGAALSAATTSNAITITGVDSAANISIVGGEYSVSTDGGTNWSDWSTTTPATVSLNNQIKVRLTSSASYSTAATATLTIGGVDGAFSVTTGAAPSPVNGACGGSHGQTLSNAPGSNLCTAGSAGGVTGSGPWSWTCSGSNGGSNASCSASLYVAPPSYEPPPPPPTTLTVSTNGSGTVSSTITQVTVYGGATLAFPATIASGGVTLTLPTPATGSATPVTLTLNGQSLNVTPGSAGTVLRATSATVTLNGVPAVVQLISLSAGSITVSASGSGQTLLSIGNGATQRLLASGGTTAVTALATLDAASGETLLAVSGGVVVLPGSATAIRSAAATETEIHAGETVTFDSAGQVISHRAASGGNGAGDPIRVTNLPAALTLNATIPNLKGSLARLDGQTPEQAAMSLLGPDFTLQSGGQNSTGVLPLQVGTLLVPVLPLGSLDIDPSQPDGLTLTADGLYQFVSNGLVVQFAPSVRDSRQLATDLAQSFRGAATELRGDGVIVVRYQGTDYILQADLTAETGTGAGTGMGFDLNESGHLRYRDAQGFRQVLHPAFADLATLRATFTAALPGIAINCNNGVTTATLGGTTYTLVPDYALSTPPANQAGRSWWNGADGKLYIRNSDGTAQGFAVR